MKGQVGQTPGDESRTQSFRLRDREEVLQNPDSMVISDPSETLIVLPLVALIKLPDIAPISSSQLVVRHCPPR